jgi:hypothetical protein
MPTVIDSREHPQYPGYRFWSDGTYQSRWTRKKHEKGFEIGDKWSEHRLGFLTKGYRQLWLCTGIGNEKRKEYIHLLVLKLFIGERPNGLVACHNDGNKLNCFLDNLRWDTQQSNIDDKRRHGTNTIVGRGERAGRAKLTEQQVRAIIVARRSGATYQSIADKYGMEDSSIALICKGKNWRHVYEQMAS